MRISIFEAGLAVLASLPLVAAKDRFVFSRDSFVASAPVRSVSGQKYAIYEIGLGNPRTKSFSFNWSETDTLVTKPKPFNINLCFRDTGTDTCNVIKSGLVNGDTSPGSSASTPTTTPSVKEGDNRRRQSIPPNPNTQQTPLEITSGRVSATISVVLNLLSQHRGKTLFFEVEWPESGGGKSYSPAFTVVSQNDDVQFEERFLIPPEGTAMTPVIAEKPAINQSIGTVTGTGQPSATTRAGPHTDGFNEGGGRVGGSSSEGGGASLATGAIVGIAIGALAFLVVIGLVVWLLFRRRKKSSKEAAVSSYGHGRTRTDELMAEKEANAGIDAAPHSPYSDEGGNNSLHQVNPAAVPPVMSHHRDLSQQPLQPAHDAARSYTPYSDHPSGTFGSPKSHITSVAAADTAARDGSPIPGRVTPHGMTQYAHLVEEGMTEDEIKRLEEEERALDAAIEQAGRRP